MKAALTSIAWKVLINFECIRAVSKYMYDSFILYLDLRVFFFQTECFQAECFAYLVFFRPRPFFLPEAV